MDIEHYNSLPSNAPCHSEIDASVKQNPKAEIRYGPLETSHLDVVTPFLLGHFFPREPLAMAVKGFSAEKDMPWLRTAIEFRLSLKVSIGAWDSKTNELIGTAINETEIANKPHPVTLSVLTTTEFPRTHAMKQFMQEVHRGQNLFKTYNVQALGHVSMVCVRPDYGGQGIAAKLIQLTEEAFIKQNIRTFFAEVTSEFTARIFQKRGYVVLAELAYVDFKHNGEVVFQDLGEHKVCCLVAKHVPEVNKREFLI